MNATDIIFKAKSASTGEWVQGYLVQGQDNEGHKHFKIENAGYVGHKYYEIDRNTICIGFKDKEGKFWFSGDKVIDSGFSVSGVILFSEDGFVVCYPGHNMNPRVLSPRLPYLAVTGNIHD